MAIKNSAAKSAAQKLQFYTCNGCMGRFAAGTGIIPPTNKYGFRIVCKSCYKQYISKTVIPLPGGAAEPLKQKIGSFATYGGTGILSNANGGLISANGAKILSNANGGFMGMNSGTLIGTDHATLIGTDHATLISESGSTLKKSSNLISESGSTLIGKIR